MVTVHSVGGQTSLMRRAAVMLRYFVVFSLTIGSVATLGVDARAGATRVCRVRYRGRVSKRQCVPSVQCQLPRCEATSNSNCFIPQRVEDLSALFNSNRYELRVMHDSGGRNIVECWIHLARHTSNLDPALVGLERTHSLEIALLSITTLRIAGEEPTDDDWNRFRQLRGVRRIEINNCSLRENDFATLCSFPELRELQISGMQIGEAGLAAIVACSKLEDLSLGRYSGWASLKTTPPFAACRVLSRLARIASLKNLKTLNLSGIPINEPDIQCIASLPKLEELDINGTGSTDQTLDKLRATRTLRKIKLRDDPAESRQWIGEVKDRGLDNTIASLAVLRFCDVRPDCKVLFYYDPFLEQIKTGEDLRGVLVRGKRLQESLTGGGDVLRLRGSGITDHGARWIAEIPEISTLDVSECNITDAGVSYIARMPGLTEINLWGTKVTARGLRVLSAAADLKVIWIDARNTELDELTGTLKVLRQVNKVKLVTRPSRAESLSAITKDIPNVVVDVFAGSEKEAAFQ